MTDIDTMIWFRGIERLFIVLGGLGFGWIGLLLFKWGVGGPSKLVVDHEKTKVQWVNAAPGSIAMLFGAVVLGIALTKTMFVSDERTVGPLGQQGERKTVYQWSGEQDEVIRFLEKIRALEKQSTLSSSEIEGYQKQAIELLAKLNAIKSRANTGDKPN